MKSPPFSKPLQAALLLTATLTVIALLKPEAIDAPTLPAPEAGSRTPESPGAETLGREAPWVRLAGEGWKPADVELRKVDEAAAAVLAPAAPPPSVIAPSKPIAPDPLLTYLGRMDQDGRSYVFLGRGAEPQVVEIGGLLDPQWKVEKASATGVELRFLPLNETRFIAVQ